LSSHRHDGCHQCRAQASRGPGFSRLLYGLTGDIHDAGRQNSGALHSCRSRWTILSMTATTARSDSWSYSIWDATSRPPPNKIVDFIS